MWTGASASAQQGLSKCPQLAIFCLTHPPTHSFYTLLRSPFHVLRDFMHVNLGLSRLTADRIEPMTPQAACQRMCANLAGIYRCELRCGLHAFILAPLCNIST